MKKHNLLKQYWINAKKYFSHQKTLSPAMFATAVCDELGLDGDDREKEFINILLYLYRREHKDKT